MFLNFLLEQNIINEQQFNRIINSIDSEFEGNVTKAILAAGVSEDAVTTAKASFYKIPYQKVAATSVLPEVLKYVEEDAARHYKFVPIQFADGVLSVGVTEPENIEAMNALQFISIKLNVPFKVFLISYTDYISIIENYRGNINYRS